MDLLLDPFASDCPSFLEGALAAPARFGPARGGDGASSPVADDAAAVAVGKLEEGVAAPARGRKRQFAEVAQCAAFSWRGSYMLCGYIATGHIAVWDMLTQRVVRSHRSHRGTVSSVSYLPRSESRLVLTSGLDGAVSVLDLAGMQTRFALQVPSLMVASAAAAPSYDGAADRRCLVCCARFTQSPVDEAQKNAMPWPLLVDLDLNPHLDSSGAPPSPSSPSSPSPSRPVALKWELPADAPRPARIAAAFSPCGTLVFVGGAAGEVHVFDVATKARLSTQTPLTPGDSGQTQTSSQTQTQTQTQSQTTTTTTTTTTQTQTQTQSKAKAKAKGWIKSISVHASKIALVVVTDKILHMLRVDGATLRHVRDLQDPVEGLKWSATTVSGDGEYILAAATTHDIHVWNVLGRHIAHLSPPDAGLVRAVLWHPSRPVAASLGREGQINLWATHRSEGWSAFAPNFVILDESQPYHEREDEFDKNGNDEVARGKGEGKGEGEMQDGDGGGGGIMGMETDGDDMEADGVEASTIVDVHSASEDPHDHERIEFAIPLDAPALAALPQ